MEVTNINFEMPKSKNFDHNMSNSFQSSLFMTKGFSAVGRFSEGCNK